MISAPLLLLVMFAQQGGAELSSDPARAVVQLQEAIRKDPQIESNYTELGNVLLRTQNFSEAAVVLETAKSRFPGSGQAALSLGVAYYGLRRFPEAIAAFLEAGRLAPEAEQPIAFLHRMSDNWGDRREDVLALFRTYVATHRNSALAHLALGSATRDVAELQQAVKLNPQQAEAYTEIGGILEARRDYPGAIAAFRRAAELKPRDPVPHFRLSRLYVRTGNTARGDAERALHEKLSAEQKAELDRRQAATKHLQLSVRP